MSKAGKKNVHESLTFRRASEVIRPPQREKTDEEIRAEMQDIVRRTTSVLQTLTKL
ncbi:hypothetical protein DESA109040_19610 [Deinococcus saxicola]|uniref:hypothetical protein n=1 Tax=Deinococcus saxicola TaxID=249406 RepID=UPI0039EE7FC4